MRGLGFGASPRCRRRGTAGAVGAGGFRLRSRLRQLWLSPRGGGPARREPGRLPASEPRALCWRRRDWRARRRLLAPQRRPGQTLLGTLKNFPGARLAANSRESLGRAPSLPKSQSVEPPMGFQRPFQTAPKQRRTGSRGRGRRAPGGSAGTSGRTRRERHRGLRQPPAPAQWRDCTCRRPPRCSLGGEARPEKNLTAVVGHSTRLLLGGGGNRCHFPP